MIEPDTTRPDGEDEPAPFALGAAADEAAAGGHDGNHDGNHDGGPDYGSDDGNPGAAIPAGQLDLGDDDVSLPWLEGDDSGDEDYDGYNTGQLLALVLGGLLVIGLVVGGIWWATRATTDPELVADGGIIKAPAQPYKEKPSDPGGKTFDGTGDTSFAVSEGQVRPAKLGSDTVLPPPAPPPAPSPSASAGAGKPAAQPASKPAPAKADAVPAVAAIDEKGVGVQVAAYSTRSSAEAGWAKLQREYGDLAGLRPRIVEGKADIGTVYRVQAVAGDLGAANALCRKLKAAGLNCQVKN